MSQQLNGGTTKIRQTAEFLVFLAASALGVYSLGRGGMGLFEPGQEIDLVWLAVTGVTMLILFAQMGRVHDTWPRNGPGESLPTTTDTGPEQSMQSKNE